METDSESGSRSKDSRPYISADRILPEITVKAVLLGVLLSALLAGANAYLGLLAGMTVSASIPAAVLSMALLRAFRRSNILENNIVQTAASAGESLAAGVIFTFPALIILGAWTDFDYVSTTVIAAMGGLIGVLFTIPLRRALVVESPLKFPEGTATAEVLKVGDSGGSGIRGLIVGAALGATFKLGASGFGLWTQAIEGARRVGGSVAYFGSNLLPALVAVGYIVGLNISILMFLGGALNWFVAIPILAASTPWPDDVSALDRAWTLWSTQTRYLGVGAMVVGGVWALIRMGRSILSGIESGLQAYRKSRGGDPRDTVRTEREFPMPWVLTALCLSVIPLFFVFNAVTHHVGISLFMAVIMLVAGFLFSAVASYMAGLVGSSNNPISGVTIATILTASLLLFLLMGGENAAGPAAAILIGAVVCCAAAIGGDNMQDLKAGHLLGATPRNQQIVQIIGVLSAAVVMAPILSLLLRAYGIVEPVSPDREALPAPQATLMASVARGVFDRDLPWLIVSIGALLAIGIVIVDVILEKRGATFRTPVLAVAVGLYLPLELETAILVGGLIAWFAARPRKDGVADAGLNTGADSKRASAPVVPSAGARRGLLFAAGLITGEALLGILLAIPIVMNKGSNPLALNGPESPLPESIATLLPSVWPGLLFMLLVVWTLHRTAAPSRR